MKTNFLLDNIMGSTTIIFIVIALKLAETFVVQVQTKPPIRSPSLILFWLKWV
jgi:hypothetical protein